MVYHIEPYVGVGPIRFGMIRQEVHQLFSQDRQPTMHRGGDKPGDYFPAFGLFVDYHAPGVCEFVEFGGPLVPVFREHSFLGQPYRLALAWFKANDSHCETNGAGLISKRLGIALYARSPEKNPDEPVEAVAVFEQGYYDRLWTFLRGPRRTHEPAEATFSCLGRYERTTAIRWNGPVESQVASLGVGDSQKDLRIPGLTGSAVQRVLG